RRAERGRGSKLLVIPALGGAERTLADGFLQAGTAWTPDGRWLVVSRREKESEPNSLYAVSLATGELKRLTHGPASAWTGDDWPAVSADGTIAFARGSTRTNAEIYVL